ncbi:MAG: transcription termination/antitermination protein NusA [Candidatus Liptonbacteria bacterium CG11_big_fil_rev_8_21_14_0_20_35_14]|uniref:Transcription termination/antitermination protein NusA n=1 Tax=Candidatus Liptonbacteria bacterium CG11_big_fil_rev_8_21_14_0_20_35_14 TaxID=1974634 RepID=A0A2H0N7W3_9BACT|nr:MAG: transcription termination/antitermination protein NusA [Candidatus Liptonbacteria bacterium CG11_big_fil_rev_8_21_14_0_20_35_14]
MNLKELVKVAEQIASEKNIQPETVIEVVENSLAAAYRKEYGYKGMIIRAKLDLKSGDVLFESVKTVVDENTVRIPIEGEEEHGEEVRPKEAYAEEDILPRYNPERHILIKDIETEKPELKVGDEIVESLPAPQAEFGRIAAQTAKQNILQRLREIERSSIVLEFKGREETIVSGIVRRFERGNVYIDLGRAEGIMWSNESITGEHYKIGDRLKFYVIAVQEGARFAQIVLSRNHPKFLSKLFESEVPEISDGTVEIKGIAREAGSRSKIAVYSNDENVDAVGSFVGQRGTRVMAVNNEIGQEKIDIIEWSNDPEEYISHSLSPAKVSRIELGERREVKVFVLEDQLSLAIGRGGQNVRLAANLTGFKIDVRSEQNPEEVINGGIAEKNDELVGNNEIIENIDTEEMKEKNIEENN